MNTQPTTLADQFRAEFAKGVVPGMIKALASSKKRTTVLLWMVMLTTYAHVAWYLKTDTGLSWFGLAVPAIVDLSMLQMLDILQTRGMRKPAKLAASLFGVALGLVSGTLNVVAAGDAFSAFVFASLVGIAIGTKLVAALMGPDFAAMEQAEQQIAPTAPVVDEQARARRSEAAKRGAATRKANTAKGKRTRKPTHAPVSPGMAAVAAPSVAELEALV